jgi:hypothetical protein
MSPWKVRLEGTASAPLPARGAVYQSFIMPPCHTIPFMRPGVVIDTPAAEPSNCTADAAAEQCDYCGSVKLEWRKCKLICADCRQINKSCADL